VEVYDLPARSKIRTDANQFGQAEYGAGK